MKVIKVGTYAIVGQSYATATFHKMVGAKATMCNARGGMSIRPASVTAFENAKDSRFCEKCFPHGKPTDFTFGEI